MQTRLWLSSFSETLPDGLTDPVQVARAELKAFPDLSVRLQPAESELTCVREGDTDVLSGTPEDLLRATYNRIFAHLLGEPFTVNPAPSFRLRMLNFWDNLDGSVERGYAGRSLFFEDGRVAYDRDRIRLLARLLASVGINVICINNVNVLHGAQRLMEDLLPDVAGLADLLRPFGIRVMLSADFALPLRHGIDTADPFSPDVQAFWAGISDKIWTAIPDFAGFLVKAHSEHRPGPFTYGRNHADGANMLARAVRPHGGVVIWRAFVYNCMQDWRDTKTDRPMAAYNTYVPLDGAFDDNVILQVKNGPFDFQVREPVSPTLLAMKQTRLALEFQLTQEYTGHQIDVYGMPGLFREVLDDLDGQTIDTIAAVANLGRDGNFVGHPLAALSLFAYGTVALSSDANPEAVTRRFVRLMYPALDASRTDKLTSLLLGSRETYEKYTAPLGICWMVTPGVHYGPSPDGYEYQSWGTYHKANRNAVGIDRTGKGTGYLLQYPASMQDRWADPATCPDNMLLFFHRIAYDYVMRDGRTLIQRIYDDHFEGYEEVEAMQQTLEDIADCLPEEDAAICRDRMTRQLQNAREWRDIINTFFYRLSGVPDAKGRTIYD